MKPFIFLFMVFVMMAPSVAMACMPIKDESKKNIDAVIESSIFIGIVQVVKREEIKNKGYRKFVVTYKVIEPYKTSKDIGQEIIVDDPIDHSCQRGHAQVGDIVEEMFFRRGENIRNSEQSEYLIMAEIRKELIGDFSSIQAFQDKKAACENEGNVWEIKAGWYNQILCRQPAKDSGKICSDNKECQGGCFAKIEDIPADVKQKLSIKNLSRTLKGLEKEHPEIINYSYQTNGICGEWKNEKRCGYMVVEGKVSDQKGCIGE